MLCEWINATMSIERLNCRPIPAAALVRSHPRQQSASHFRGCALAARKRFTARKIDEQGIDSPRRVRRFFATMFSPDCCHQASDKKTRAADGVILRASGKRRHKQAQKFSALNIYQQASRHK